MNQWSIKTKLVLLCSFLVAVILATGFFNYVAERRLVADLNEANTVQLPSVRLATLTDMMHDGLRGVAFRALLFGDRADEQKEIAGELKEMQDSMAKYVEELEKLDIKPEIRQALDVVKPDVAAYSAKTEEIVGLALSNQKSAAYEKVPEMQKAFEALEESLGKFGDLIEKSAIESSTRSSEEAQLAMNVSLALMIFGVFLGIAASFWVVRDLIATLRMTLEKLQSSSMQLASASQLSSTTAASLSEASTEQAASLQETMASVEEISAMVSQNAESSNKALKTAQDSRSKSEEGSTNVNEMLGSIEEIRRTNDEILNQMESSNKEFSDIVKIISEIGSRTKVINDIVFQTKLLSFNASVEAARAGEHGKGFAVVAEEVGNLAQMSGNAAKEISDLLANSVKKVNEIVESTTQKVDRLIETGKDKIASGQATAHKCKISFQHMTENARSIASMVEEIANASKEQAQGVQEINKAIAQLDHVTQQNATVAHQSASQASELTKESNTIGGAISELSMRVMGNDSKLTDSEQGSRDGASVVPLRREKKEVSSPKPNRTVAKVSGSDVVPNGSDPRFEEF